MGKKTCWFRKTEEKSEFVLKVSISIKSQYWQYSSCITIMF